MSAKTSRTALIAIVSAIALVLGTGATATAAVPDAPELDPSLVTGTVPLTVSAPGTPPVVDSEIGRGASLTTTPNATVSLGSAAAGVASVLVRVAALSAPADLTVYRSGGVPGLAVAAGRSASTTLLLPVQGGGVQLWADAPVNVRLEVLAGFADRADRPGTMLALPEPVLRADTTAGLAASTIDGAEVSFGVVGAGGVPSENVRSVSVTYDLVASRATTVETSGQRLRLEAGRTVVTTIVSPDANGTVGIRALGGDVQGRAYVTGWMPDAPFQATQQSLPGSFLPTAELSAENSARIGGERRTAPAKLDGNVDAEYAIVLVTATDATETTLLDLGLPYTGRARGAVVDGQGGALPQMLIVPVAGAADDVLTLRRGQASVSWAPVGEILGAEVARPEAADPTISITSPAAGAHINLEQGGYFTLEGKVDAPAASVDSVEISGPEGLIGTADVRVDDEGVHWTFGAAAPRDGTFAYTAVVRDRAGATASATRDVVIEAVDEDDVVVAPDVWVFNEDPAVTDLRVIDDHTVEVYQQPEFAPGDTLVSAASAATPDGLYRTAAAIDRVGDRWRVTTTDASLTDVFFQVDIDQQDTYHDLGDTRIDDDVRDSPDNTPGTIYGEGDTGYETAYIAKGDQVDLTPDPGGCVSGDLDLDAGAGAGADDPACTVDTTVGGGGDAVPSSALWASGDVHAAPALTSGGIVAAAGSDGGWEQTLGINATVKWEKASTAPGFTFKDYLKSEEHPERTAADEFREMVRSKKVGLAVSLKAQLGLKFFAKLDTSITWKWGFIPTGIAFKSFKVGLTTTLKATVSAKFYLTAVQTLKAYNTIASFNLPSVTVWAGPIPIVITNDIEMIQKTETKLEAQASGEVGIFRVDTFGYQYKAGEGWSQIDEKPTVVSSPFDPKPAMEGLQVKLEGSFSSGPSMKATNALWGIAGTVIEAGVPAGIKATWTYRPLVPDMNVTVTVFVKLTLSGKLGSGKVIDKLKKLFSGLRGGEFEFEFYSQEWSWDIWKGKWPIIEPPQPSAARSPDRSALAYAA